MNRVRTDEDICPLSDFRAGAASLIAHVRENGRPLVLTQRGRSTAVVLDVRAYERLLEEIEVLRDIRIAEAQVARGEHWSTAELRADLLGTRGSG